MDPIRRVTREKKGSVSLYVSGPAAHGDLCSDVTLRAGSLTRRNV